MLVNYLQFKNTPWLHRQPKRGKIIALSVVGGVFVFLALYAIWQRNFNDTLIGYAPSDTVLYIHFSRPKINNPAKIDQVLEKIFSDLQLADYNNLDINREVAVIGRLENNQVKYGVIIKTDRPAKVKRIFDASQTGYKKLSYNTFFLADKNWLDDYRSDGGRQIKSNIGKRFYPLSSINIYASARFFSVDTGDINSDFIYQFLKNENNDLIISLKSQGGKLKMYYGGLSSAVRSPDKFKAQDLPLDISGDLILASSDFYALLNNWQDNLSAVSIDDYQLFTDSKLATYLNTYLTSDNRRLFLFAVKNDNNSGWLFSDYDFYLSMENIYSGRAEEILKNILAFRYPAIKNVYLSDGTKVAELLPDAEQFAFLEQNGVKYLYSPDNHFKFMYKTAGNNIIISNSEQLMSYDWPEFDGHYLRFNSDLLLSNGLGWYLSFFDFLEIGGQGIILK